MDTIKTYSGKTCKLLGPLAGTTDTLVVQYNGSNYKYCKHCWEIYKAYRSRCPQCNTGRVQLRPYSEPMEGAHADLH